ncbi:MAG: FkbM family methyltransferase [Vicinamibacteria bacterium]|nr:FkbM family methyltransferase [Vicinamibacteria bacterium]
MRRATLVALSLGFAGLGGCAAHRGPTLEQTLARYVPADLRASANRGREILGPDGFLAIPKGVRRVWVDVGAHHLETTKAELRYPDVAVIAIEPLKEAWAHWPDSDRVIGIPVAVYLDRGTMDFHVNALDDTSSLLESTGDDRTGALTKTVEVRKVPVIRLEDVLNAVPEGIAIAYVKTDVQGVDLQVLQSAGESLRRVERVRSEVTNLDAYKKLDGKGMATETEMKSYLRKMGFDLIAEDGVQADRGWLDQIYLNRQRAWVDRLWHDFRFGSVAN